MRDLQSIIEANNTRAVQARAPVSSPRLQFRYASPTAFVSARDRSSRPQFLTPTPAADLWGHQLFLSKDEKVGYAISPDGDLQSVFNNGGPRGAGKLAIIRAISQGARTLNAFDGYLTKLYTDLGFGIISRVSFDDALAPIGWNYELYGWPDVVFMEFFP